MSIYEAMNILGLHSNFTEEELNKKYREKAMKWHPDECNDPKASLKMQKINEAKRVLKEHFFSYKNDSTKERYQYRRKNNDFEFEFKKQDYINRLSYFLIGVDKVAITGEKSNDTIFALVYLAVSAEIDLKKCKTENILEKTYFIYKEEMIELLGKYILNYCYENLLDCDCINANKFLVAKKYEINVNDSIGSIYFQLQNILSKQNILKKSFIKMWKMLK